MTHSSRPRTDDPCPCRPSGSPHTFGTCCGPLVIDGEPAATPEALMRSRYTAFTLHDEQHLWRTWHPSTRPREVADLGGVRWTGLDVLDAPNPEGDSATVTFEARFVRDDGVAGSLAEHSRFARRAGRWFYVDGDELG